MTEKVIRYGFLGCGMMGQEHIKNLAIIPGTVVTTVLEPDETMWLELIKLVPHVKRVHSLDALLTSDAIDALIITTPNYQHAEQLLAIFEQTTLPVLVEKPICTQSQDVIRLRDAANNHPAPVWIGMEYRYMPPVKALRDYIQSSELGSVKMLSIREHRFPFLTKVGDWNRFNHNTGGTLVEKCCHL